MAKIGVAALLRGILVLVNDDVEITGEHRSDLAEALEVELSIPHKPRQAERTQVTDRRLVRSRVLDDLRTKVAGLDRAQVLLVGLGIGRILVEELRATRLDLRVQNHLPNLLRRHRLATATLLLLPRLKFLEGLAMAIRKTRGLIR